MKKSAFWGFLITALIFTSCDLFDKVDDVSFEAELAKSFEVNETAAGADKAYTHSQIINALDNFDINKYKDNVKSMQVESVTVVISNYDGKGASDIQFKDGQIAFGDQSQSTATVLTAISAVNLATASSGNKAISVPYTQADLDKIAALLFEDKTVKAYATGTLSKTPVSFKINVIVKVKVTANALS